MAAAERIQIEKNIYLDEHVPKSILDKFGRDAVRFISRSHMKVVQGIRDYFGRPMTINNYWVGGPFQNRGFREPYCTEGARLSAHKRMVATDFNIAGLTDEEVQMTIRRKWEHNFRDLGLTTIESKTYGWTHISSEWTNSDVLIVVPNPIP